MPRGRKPRAWVKIDCNGILRGSVNWILTLEEQAIWVKMIAYSEVCGGPSGYIQDNDDHGLPMEFLAHELHCPIEALQMTIDKMADNNSIEKNGSGIIRLIHFDDYQFTEYDRQKPYRQAKQTSPEKFKQGKYADSVCTTKEEVEERLAGRKSK